MKTAVIYLAMFLVCNADPENWETDTRQRMFDNRKDAERFFKNCIGSPFILECDVFTMYCDEETDKLKLDPFLSYKPLNACK